MEQYAGGGPLKAGGGVRVPRRGLALPAGQSTWSVLQLASRSQVVAGAVRLKRHLPAK